MRLLHPIDANKPVFCGVGLLQVGQIKVLIPNDGVTCAIISRWASEIGN